MSEEPKKEDMQEIPAGQSDEELLEEQEEEEAEAEAKAAEERKAKEEAAKKQAAEKAVPDPFGGIPDPGFVHLHNHTDYSLLDGAAKIKDYVKKALATGMRALAITDHGNMFGAIDFYQACKEAGIKPIIGCEFYVNPESHTYRPNKEMGESDRGHRYHLILLAMNDKGYHNLMELNSIAWVEGQYYRPRIDDKLIQEHSEGVICLSACLAGEILQNLLDNRYEEARRRVLWFKSVFGDRYYLELQDHGLEEQKRTNPLLVRLAHECGVPLVCTNDIHYIEQADAQAQEVLLCIGTGSKLKEEGHFRFPCQEFYFKTPQQMKELFSWCPEAIENTRKVAERCNLEIRFPGPLLPIFQPPKDFRQEPRYQEFMDLVQNSEEYRKFVSPEVDEKMNPQSRLQADYLILLSYQGLVRRYGEEKAKEYRARMNHELGVIIKMDFQGYFLIVRDYIYWAKTHGIPVGPGRGSGAGSIVAYCIDITNVDPMEYALLFERFLNPERVSMPDFDVDFDFEFRQNVIDYVTEHYGKDHVAQIATFGTLKPKAAVKDVARVLDIPYDESNQIAKLISDDPKLKTLEQAFSMNPELAKVEEDLTARGGYEAMLFPIARKLQGMIRNTGTHACGLVIGQTKLVDYVPLFVDPKTGRQTTQYDKHYIEDCGLVKMDFLGLKTLTLIRHCVDLIHKKDPAFDMDRISLEDKDTFRMLQAGDSMMVFQFESSGMQDILRQAHPNNIEDLVALNALYRPGPMQFIPNYIKWKANPQTIEYPDPDFVDILKGTYGVIVYQEQVMQVAQVFAGYTLGQADILRRIMGKKQVEKLAKEELRFLKMSKEKGRDEKHAKAIFEMLKPFAGYGFNKSHAVAYSVVAYQTAYLKCHYPAEFLAANLTNESGSPDKFNEYLELSKEMHIDVLAPDINKSGVSFSVVDGKVVYGLAGIKNVGEEPVTALVAEREKNGPFKSFLDYLMRMGSRWYNSKILESLIKAGAFDSLKTNRATLLANMEAAVKFVEKRKEENAYGQISLFDSSPSSSSEEFVMEPHEDWTPAEKLESEKALLGFYVSGHPLDQYAKTIKECVRVNVAKPEEIPYGKETNEVAAITTLRPYTTKKGTAMAFLTLTDKNGSFDATLFPKAYEQYKAILANDQIYGFIGKFEQRNDKPSFVVDQVLQNPDDLQPINVTTCHIRIRKEACTQDNLSKLHDLCLENGGPISLRLVVLEDDKKTTIACGRAFNVSYTDNFTRMVKEQVPIEGIWFD